MIKNLLLADNHKKSLISIKKYKRRSKSQKLNEDRRENKKLKMNQNIRLKDKNHDRNFD